MRGEFFIDGDKIYLFPRECVISEDNINSDASSALDSKGINGVKESIQPMDNNPSSATLAIIFPGVNIVKQLINHDSTMSLPNVGALSASKISPSMITPVIARQSNLSHPNVDLSANNVLSAMFMPGIKRKLVSLQPNARGVSSNSVPSATIMPVTETSTASLPNDGDVSASKPAINMPVIIQKPILSLPNVGSPTTCNAPPTMIMSGIRRKPIAIRPNIKGLSARSEPPAMIFSWITSKPIPSTSNVSGPSVCNVLSPTIMSGITRKPVLVLPNAKGVSANSVTSTMIMPVINLDSTSSMPNVGGLSASNDPSAAIMPIITRTSTASLPVVNNPSASIPSTVIMSGISRQSTIMTSSQTAINVPSSPRIFVFRAIRQQTPATTLSQTNVSSSLIDSKDNIVKQPTQSFLSTTSSQSANVSSSINSKASIVTRPTKSIVSTTLNQAASDYYAHPFSNKKTKAVSKQDAAILIAATNEMEASCKVSPPQYIKSQKNGTILYHSSHLYVVSKKSEGKIYYKCRNKSCAATAYETDGVVYVSRPHNHEPRREDYEALVTMQELKKAAAANPTEKLKNIYKQTINSRLCEVPDLRNYPKAAPSLKSVRETIRRVIDDIHPTPRFKRPVNLFYQNSPNTQVSPPEYLKSQKNGIILYYSSYLYTMNHKQGVKNYYKCRSKTCQATAIEFEGGVIVNRQHNHEPPREEYEALVTRQELKKAVAANPDEKLDTIYQKTLSSRISKVPDLIKYPKAAPLLRSVRDTLNRAIKNEKTCRSKDQLSKTSVILNEKNRSKRLKMHN